jgi:hypothetical protein
MDVDVRKMSGRRRDDDTIPFATGIAGNELYHRAMFAIGLSGAAVTTVLETTLRAIGSSPGTITIEELAAMLPEIERRLLMLVPVEDAKRSVARLRRLVFEWEG